MDPVVCAISLYLIRGNKSLHSYKIENRDNLCIVLPDLSWGRGLLYDTLIRNTNAFKEKRPQHVVCDNYLSFCSMI